MDEEFDILTVKILAGEASAEEQARLEQLLAQKPELRRDFDDLKIAWESVREIGPLARALQAPSCSIPSTKLSELQAAVKKKFKDPEESIARPGGAGRQAQTASRRVELVRKDRSQLSNKANTAFAFLKHWSIRVAPMGIALLILAALTAGILLISSRTATHIAAGATEAVAYVLRVDGGPDVRRAGKPVDARAGAPLWASDEVRLSKAAKIGLITPNGYLELSGPMTLRAGQLATNRTDKTRSADDRGGIANEADALRVALFRPAKQLLASALVVTTRNSQSIPLYSPLGATANLTPLILWRSETGKTYDIVITDEFDPQSKALMLSGVVPPVAFADVAAWRGRTLASDGLYRIVLSETGNRLSACEYTFRTLKSAESSTPAATAERLIHAYRILSTEPSRLGDALVELLVLTPGLAESELALRLKLYVFGQRGYREDFNAVAAQLNPSDPIR